MLRHPDQTHHASDFISSPSCFIVSLSLRIYSPRSGSRGCFCRHHAPPPHPHPQPPGPIRDDNLRNPSSSEGCQHPGFLLVTPTSPRLSLATQILFLPSRGGNCRLQHGNKLLFHSVFVTKQFSYDLCNKEILLKICLK